MGRPVVVSIIGDNRRLDTSLGQSEGKLRRFGAASKVAMLGLAGGTVIAGRALFGMAKDAAEDARQQRLLENTLRRSAKATSGQVSATERWISAQGKALGVSDDELRPALGNLVRATKDVAKAQRLGSLAMDVSRGSGKNLSVVSKDLAKAYQGNVNALKKYQIETKNADGTTKSFNQVQAELKAKFDGSAEAGATAGSRIKVWFDEAKESIGARFLPAAEKLGNWFLNKGVPAISKFGTWIKNLAPRLKELGGKVLTGLRKAFDGLKDGVRDAQPFLDLMGKAFKNVLVPIMKTAANVVLPALGTAFRLAGKALGAIGETGRFMWNNVLAPVFKFMANAISFVLDKLGDVFSALGKVPKMGWAKDLGRDLHNASDAANDVKNSIGRIPSSKEVRINLKVFTTDAITGGILGALGVRTNTRTTVSPSASRIVGSSSSPSIATTSSTQTINLRLSADVVDQLTRGREYQAAIDAYRGEGGRVLARPVGA